jgi:hypothetical protein
MPIEIFSSSLMALTMGGPVSFTKLFNVRNLSVRIPKTISKKGD